MKRIVGVKEDHDQLFQLNIEGYASQIANDEVEENA